MKTVYTTGQVASLCMVAPQTVTNWCDAGLLKCFRVPNSLARRIPKKTLLAFMQVHGLPLGELERQVYTDVLLIGLSPDQLPELAAHLPESQGFRLTRAASSFEAGLLAQASPPAAVIVRPATLGRIEAGLIAQAMRESDPKVVIIAVGNSIDPVRGCDTTVDADRLVREIRARLSRIGAVR